MSETQKAEDAKQAYATEQAKNEELTRKLEAAEKTVDRLQDSAQRFEIKHALQNHNVHLNILLIMQITSANLNQWFLFLNNMDDIYSILCFHYEAYNGSFI